MADHGKDGGKREKKLKKFCQRTRIEEKEGKHLS